jgi:hypothetical protein
MRSSESFKKRKQSPSVGETRTLLNFFGTKRPKRGSSVLAGSTTLSASKSVGDHTDIIIISDDEDHAQARTIPIPAEEILDLSFSGDEWDSRDDELELIEDEIDNSTEPSNAGFSLSNESSQCLGNRLVADSAILGTCRICGLLLLDATEQVCSTKFSGCLITNICIGS